MTNTNLFKKASIFLALLLISFSLILPATAEEISFNITPIIPENQVAESAGYFDLIIQPGQKQTLQMEISNQSSEEKIFEVDLVSASTTTHGMVDYTTPDIKDESLVYPIAEFSDIDKQVTVPANTNHILNIDLEYPEEKFEGIILGGIKVKNITARLEREENKEEDTDQGGTTGMTIYNEYEYVVAVRLQQNTEVVEPNFELVNVEFGTFNSRAAIHTEIRNTQPRLIGDAHYSASISPKGKSEELFTLENLEFDMAPNSTMNYPFTDSQGFGIDGGNYTYRGKVEFEGEVWEFEQDFTIAQQSADEVNKQAVNQHQAARSAGIPTWLLIVIIIAVILIIALIFIILKLRKNTTVIDLDDLDPSN